MTHLAFYMPRTTTRLDEHPDPERAMHRLPHVATMGVPWGKHMLPVRLPLVLVDQTLMPWATMAAVTGCPTPRATVPQFARGVHIGGLLGRLAGWSRSRGNHTWLIQYYFIA